MSISEDQILNRIMAGVSITKKVGNYLAKSFSSEKEFKTKEEAEGWLRKQGL